jgi:DNA-binding response OmpR family regulator
MNHPRDTQSPRVLVVEDDDELRCAMSSCLARAGFAVTLVATGADAVRAARTVRPDVMVIDVMLPDSGGLGVAREIRRHPDLESVPVLFTTGLDSPAIKNLLAPAPVLLKPFKKRQLVSWVWRATRVDTPAPGEPPAPAA